MENALQWIADQEGAMLQRIEQWAAINTGTFNVAGVHQLGEAVEAYASGFCDSAHRVALPPLELVDDTGALVPTPLADAWLYRRRPKAPRQLLLVVHLDTVFAKEHAFQRVTALTRNDPEQPGRRILRGPGVCDAKGGLALLWSALDAFERSRPDDTLGWTVLLNPDEEIGSPGSAALLAAEARRADFGLVFEPALEDGALVGARKGSGNFALVVRGKSAHVGRAFDEGRSAIHALVGLVGKLNALGVSHPGVIANTGFLQGGGAVNVVADFAMARFNIRVDDRELQREVEDQLTAWCEETRARDDVAVELHGGFGAPPKPLDARLRSLLEAVRNCGKALGIPIAWRDSGGVCDGNRLAAAGLANVDTLGPVGGDIHSEREYLDVDSLVPRAQLVTSLLFCHAHGELDHAKTPCLDRG